MKKEQFIEKVRELDGKQGNYELTLLPENKEKRELLLQNAPQLFIDTFEAILNQGLKVFVFEEIHRKSRLHCMSHLFLPDFNISMRIWDSSVENAQDIKFKYWQKVHTFLFPFFIDISKDTLDFTLEKLSNNISMALKDPRRGTKDKIIRPKRNRIKVSTMKIYTV
jgi:hypothetical protein